MIFFVLSAGSAVKNDLLRIHQIAVLEEKIEMM